MSAQSFIVVTIDGTRYAILKSRAMRLVTIGTIHPLPLTPPPVCGVTCVEGRTASLFDLGMSLGHPPHQPGRSNRMLVMNGDGQLQGFVVPSEDEFRCEDEPLPLPSALSLSVIQGVVIDKGIPIPVVDVTIVFDRLRRGRWLPVQAELADNALASNTVGEEVFRLFRAAGRTFAVAAAQLEPGAKTVGTLARLPLLSLLQAALTVQEGRAVAVVDLAARLGLDTSTKPNVAIGTQDGGLALAVDKDLGTRGPDEYTVASLAPLVRTSFMQAALCYQGHIVPVLDIASLLSPAEEGPLAERYHRAPPGFATQFGGDKTLGVREFLLLGDTFSVPATEVENVLAFRDIHVMPTPCSIVVGVTELDGQVLPVLDLALCFGAASRATSNWHLLLVRNYDFRALVLTESVGIERELPPDEQMPLPIEQQHQYVYGCYPDGSRGRLVLNVRALTLHFQTKLEAKTLERLMWDLRTAVARGPENEIAAQPPTPGKDGLLRRHVKDEAAKREAEEAAKREVEETIKSGRRRATSPGWGTTQGRDGRAPRGSACGQTQESARRQAWTRPSRL
ncbi:MAG: hypothetical protein GF331_05580 [Chitinivibrionales bacterium]|nr:hypothetical protein [Chitinivibrionales bacterium]